VNKVIERLFISPKLMLGYFGVLIFMAGEGLEQNWLSPFLQQHGLTAHQASTIFTVYGLMVAISSWLSGVLAEIFGVRKVMTIGLVLFFVGSFLFLVFGIPTYNFSVILPTYAVRGLAYPLFAYGFLVSVAYEAPRERLGGAVGMFWLVYAGGISVLGTGYSNIMLYYFHMENLHLLWTALIFVAVGAVIALSLSGKKSAQNNYPEDDETHSLKHLLKGLTIVYEKPKVGIGGLVRMINTSAAYGFSVFMPTFLFGMGYAENAWLEVAVYLWMGNVVFNLIFGAASDKLGWRNVVMWFGCIGCALSVMAYTYCISIHADLFTIKICAAVYGALLAAFVPLSAIMPNLAPENKGAAMSILNFGAGMSYFFGYAIVMLFQGIIGNFGVMYIYIGLYFVAAALMIFVKVQQYKNETIDREVGVAIEETL